MLYKFLASECIFIFAVVVRDAGDQRFFVNKDIVEKSCNRLLLLLILKSSKFHSKTPVLESLFGKVAGMRAQLS